MGLHAGVAGVYAADRVAGYVGCGMKAKSLFELASDVHKLSRELPAIELSKRVLAGECVNNTKAKPVNNGGKDHRTFMRDYMREYRARRRVGTQ